MTSDSKEQPFGEVRPKPSLFVRIYHLLSSLGLATTLLVLLMILTWLATLEQVDHGLHQTLLK